MRDPARLVAQSPWVMLGSVIGCAESPAGPWLDSPPPPGIATAVAPDGATLAVDDSLQMTARVLAPADWVSTGVAWSTSDSSIARVSTAGLVRGRRAGTVQVRVVFRNARGTQVQGMATVHVE